MELDDAIKTRRSVRKFSDYVVTDEDINCLIDAARWAPSWGNTQCWDFIIVQDKIKIEKLTDLYSETNPARKCSYQCSCLIVACAKMKLSGHKNMIPRTKFKEWFMFDLGMALQNLSLKAHDIGLGSVIVGSLDHDQVHKYLELPGDIDVVCVLPIGKPLDIKKSAPPRREIAEMLFFEKYE